VTCRHMRVRGQLTVAEPNVTSQRPYFSVPMTCIRTGREGAAARMKSLAAAARSGSARGPSIDQAEVTQAEVTQAKEADAALVAEAIASALASLAALVVASLVAAVPVLDPAAAAEHDGRVQHRAIPEARAHGAVEVHVVLAEPGDDVAPAQARRVGARREVHVGARPAVDEPEPLEHDLRCRRQLGIEGRRVLAAHPRAHGASQRVDRLLDGTRVVHVLPVDGAVRHDAQHAAALRAEHGPPETTFYRTCHLSEQTLSQRQSIRRVAQPKRSGQARPVPALAAKEARRPIGDEGGRGETGIAATAGRAKRPPCAVICLASPPLYAWRQHTDTQQR